MPPRVMSVLLFGSETWSFVLGTLKQLDGFHHHRAAWRMAGMQPTGCIIVMPGIEPETFRV